MIYPSRGGWDKEHAALARQANVEAESGKGLDVLWLGDGITRGWNGGVASLEGNETGALWEERFGGSRGKRHLILGIKTRE